MKQKIVLRNGKSSQNDNLAGVLRVEKVSSASGAAQGHRSDGSEAGSTNFASGKIWVNEALSQEWSEV